MMTKPGKLIEEHVATRDRSTGCWEWEGKLTEKGYGRESINGKRQRVHRYAIILDGRQPNNEQPIVRHTCDNPPCYNPDHLELGTHQDNTNDAIERGRLSKKLTEDDVRQILSLKGSRSLRSLGAEYGVDHTTIREIHNREIWKHVRFP